MYKYISSKKTIILLLEEPRSTYNMISSCKHFTFNWWDVRDSKEGITHQILDRNTLISFTDEIHSLVFHWKLRESFGNRLVNKYRADVRKVKKKKSIAFAGVFFKNLLQKLVGLLKSKQKEDKRKKDDQLTSLEAFT